MRDVIGLSLQEQSIVTFSVKDDQPMRIGLVASGYPVKRYNSKRLKVLALNPGKKTAGTYKVQELFIKPEHMVSLDQASLPTSITHALDSAYIKLIEQSYIERKIKDEIRQA